jgi:ABC-type sugar transport system ATPase subunit
LGHVELDGVSKRYTPEAEALARLDLELEEGEFVVLLGPSGCGKSTTLLLVAGLEEPTTGEIRVNGKRMNEVPPWRRDIAMVFQSYALYPHMTVAENLSFGLRMRRMERAAILQRVQEVAGRLGLQDLLERKPASLSGGQRQRVAFGRAIVRDPAVFLFDEPLSNLDAKLRSAMRAELKELHAELGRTTLYVTHDQMEAMTLADRIVVMREGHVEQVGTPREVYESPATRFVADFIGTPPASFVEGEVLEGRFEADGVRLPAASLESGPATLGVRPEDVLLEETEGVAVELEGRIRLVEPTGGEQIVHVDVGRWTLRAKVGPHLSVEPGEQRSIFLRRKRLHWFGSDGTRMGVSG